MPDQEAIEVALEDLSDVSEGESSEAEQDSEQQASEESAAEEQAVSDEQKETSSQRRRRLRREREEAANRRVSELERENARLSETLKKLKAPERSQYQNDVDYVTDRAAYAAQRQTVEQKRDHIKTQFDETEQEAEAARAEALADFNREGAKRFEDFAEVTGRTPQDGGPAITVVMSEALMESDIGPDVAYYLGKNPKESIEIANLPPIQQVRRMVELEARVAEASKPLTSKAPAPIRPVKAGSQGRQKPVSEMSMAEYAAHREKQMRGET